MKKILFFINTLQGGGAEKVLIDLLGSLDRERYSATLVAVTGGVYQTKLPDDIEYKQLVRGNSLFSRFVAKLIYRMPPKLVYRMVSKGRHNLEIAYLEGFPTSVIAAGKNNVRKIAFVHCDISVTALLNGYYKNSKACLGEYSKYDKVCFVSRNAKLGFEKSVGELENSAVVHNVINAPDVLKKSQEKAEDIFDTTGMKIVAVGRLAKEKAYDRLIRIAAELEKNYVFQICILGDGEEREYLEKLIKEHNVSSVKLLGFQKNPYTYMQQADLFVCSSLFEGYSTAVAESLILGIPVITTNCAGMDELLQNGEQGIIVDNNENSLRDGIAQIIADRKLYDNMKQAALERRDTIINSNSIDEYERIFEE